MQLVVNINNSSIADKIIWFLETLKDKGVQIIQKEQTLSYEIENLSDEYIQANWKNIVSESLKNYDECYRKTFQYKLDRAEFREMKEEI